MCLEIILVLAFLLVPVIMVLGLTYTGVWVQNGGMNQTAIAMHTYLALSTMDLFSNNVQVNSSTVAASLTPAVFTGYAQQTFTTTPAPVNDITLGGYSIYLPSNVFACTTAPSSTVTIYGFMLRDAAGNLIAAGNFTTPIPITNIGDSVPLQVTLNFTDAGLNAIAEVLN